MGVSRALRFEVFKRDGFRCAYCGRTPPQVILEVDHIDPHSLGGSDDINNLITSCFDCNRGKRNIPLSRIPGQLSENLKVLREKEAQIREYRKFVAQIERRERRDMNRIGTLFSGQYEGWSFSDHFKNVSLSNFIRSLPIDQVEQAMRLAIMKIPDDPDGTLRYFCGVCWRKIKGDLGEER